MRLRVDHERCTGHARCNTVSEDLFPIDDLGYSAVDEIEVSTGSEAIARDGIDVCPEGAIELVDES
jgi:ferredoxin